MYLLASSELRSCVEVEVTVLGSSSLIVRVVSVDIKQLRRRGSHVSLELLQKVQIVVAVLVWCLSSAN